MLLGMDVLDGDAPLHYRIRIRGCLGPTLRCAFPGLSYRAVDGNTVLEGELIDQAALYGVLAEVEALGLELLEVVRVPPHGPGR